MNVIEMRAIVKQFGPLVANDHVNFDLHPGEVHALLGENGAGKTTLMRILYGLYQADSGEIKVKGKPVTIHSPKDAIANGIGMVSQHFTLVLPLTVAENIVLGYSKKATYTPKAVEEEVAKASAKFGVEVNPSALVKHLSVGERQRVEILKALYRNVNVLIMDEPTAVLVPQEVDVLFETLERLRKNGLSVIFISHKLYEVMKISDRITVLRDGKFVGTVKKSDTTERKLANMMVGRETFGVKRPDEACQGKPLLRLTNITAMDKKGLAALKDVSLDVCEGEILGVAGVSGNGQAELGHVLTGMLKPKSGKIILGEKDLTNAEPSAIFSAGVGRIPEDRHEGVVGELSVAENLALEDLPSFIKNGMLDKKAIRANAEKLIKDFQIKASPSDHARKLSGGNMQKVILARTLSKQPKLVIASQPTRGLDVGATEYVRKKLLEQRKRGAAVLLISEDLEEVMSISDRIAVMYEGRIVGILPASQATEEELGLMMSGVKEMAHEA
ncbi:MAG TPA: ABC transporter ATP-binding protein [Longilinea sp.]|nr:ABC transporter ATP-binding protein [Longilinea sp.]